MISRKEITKIAIPDLLSKEINVYKNKMQRNSVRFQLFVMCANKVIETKSFYELSLQQINEYFQTVQIFTKEEVVKILQLLISQSETEKDANFALKKILPSIRCPFEQANNTYFLSPCCCKELFNKFTKEKYKYKLKNGKNYRLKSLFDFQSIKMYKMRESQEKYPDLPRFKHYPDTCTAVVFNQLTDIYDEKIKLDENPHQYEKELRRPLYWEPNIHKATEHKSSDSIDYNIFLIPFLRDLEDQYGKTPAHIAAMVGDPMTIRTLYMNKANMNKFDKNGDLPIHCVQSKKNLKELINCGCDINSKNKEGLTLLFLKSNFLKINDGELIEYLFEKGVDIMEPNAYGVYWGQFVNFKKFVTYEKLQSFLLQVVNKGFINNKTINKIIMNKDEFSNISREEVLRKAVIERNIDLIKALLAVGTLADTYTDEDKLTNLMIVSSKNDLELVKLFASNYCDANKINKDGENSFWISASKEYFDVSTLLYRKFEANPDTLSNSGETLMHIAYLNKRKELFYYLLDLGASPNIPSEIKKETVQFTAFLNEDDEVAEIIQNEFNGDINIPNAKENTLGHLAIINKDQKRLEYLLKRNLHIESKNYFGFSLFMLAFIYQDDKSMWQFLLDNGSDINSQDKEGNTTFFWICYEKVFSREKFDFLLKNNCDINIQNNEKDFPISRLIFNDRKEETFILINKEANIINCESKTEPIVVSLIKKNKLIFEKLIDKGANALNKQYPIIETYIQEEFFNFETLKKMKYFNLTIGVPFQTAIHKKMNEVAVFLWKQTNEEERIQISKSLDKNQQTPIIVSILNNNEYFINELIQPKYDLLTSDKDGKTPFIHLCSKQMTNWIEKIIPMLSIEQLNTTDLERNSGLTYIANNGNKELADKIFLLGVNVFAMNMDKNGIMKHYVDLLTTYNSLVQKAIQNEHLYLEILNEARKKNDDLIDYIRENRIKADEYESKEYIELTKKYYTREEMRCRNNVERARELLPEVSQKYFQAQDDYKKCQKNLEYLKNVSRKEILENINDLKKYASYP